MNKRGSGQSETQPANAVIGRVKYGGPFYQTHFLDNFIHSHQHDRDKHTVNGKWDTDNSGLLVNKNRTKTFSYINS